MKAKNTVTVLALLPVNFLAVAYGWWAAGWTSWAANWNEEPYAPPMAELGTACAVVAVIGVALLLARLWGAAAFQMIPVLALITLMSPS
ncbi:hypothetical protein [Streptomyces sp. S.PB5]|uniref:hypothetical protein n=1 Tax=Streptomyces sp. S.PB5 TaxID=3020844 RepID=UPI0025B21EFD|nr:hypothetical protein [Streptomyces sp. S.PB5]MDN3020477.1 hypothetical protein [Streptomyces sp. S.PB5]